MRLHLIRHGQTPSNVRRLLDTGIPGPGLTELGREQAAALPEALRDAGLAALYASDMVRTQLTARPLAEALGLEVAVRPGLREILAGDLEMADDDASVHTYLSTVFGWAEGDRTSRIPGSPEDGREVLARFDAVVQEAVDSGAAAVALFSHGAMIRSWCAARCANVTAEFAAQTGLTNTGIVVVEGASGDWRALTWHDEPIGGEAVEPGADTPAAEPTDASPAKHRPADEGRPPVHDRRPEPPEGRTP